MSVLLVSAFAATGVVAMMAWRDHARTLAARCCLLDDCSSALQQAVITHGGDGLPRLDGVRDHRPIRVELVPDTMTIRRLPQLWMMVTRVERRRGSAEFAILRRPTGTEFYSLTAQYDYRLEVPANLPEESLARGSGPRAQGLLDRAADCIEGVFADARVKEIGVTQKGLRLVWQAAEGRRGEHLLLRQSVFDGAGVDCAALERHLANLDALADAIDRSGDASGAVRAA